ncbi:MAG: hypothetical protein AAGM67_06995 [Bacteroidota bacterium]
MLRKVSLWLYISLALFSCQRSVQVPTSELQAIDMWLEQAQMASQDGQAIQADSLYGLAINGLEDLYALDTTDIGFAERLAELHYVVGNYNAGVAWYARVIQLDSLNMKAIYQLGRGAVQIGDTKLAHLMFEKAISMDDSDTLSRRVVQELKMIGEESYGYGSELHAKGDTSSGSSYQIFGLSLLMTAFEIDSSRTDLAQRIVDYCYEIGDTEAADRYARMTQM